MYSSHKMVISLEVLNQSKPDTVRNRHAQTVLRNVFQHTFENKLLKQCCVWCAYGTISHFQYFNFISVLSADGKHELLKVSLYMHISHRIWTEFEQGALYTVTGSLCSVIYSLSTLTSKLLTKSFSKFSELELKKTFIM